MLAPPLAPTSTTRVRSTMRTLAPLAVWLAIGVELVVIATWWPDTLRVWFDPETRGYGDFPVFYENARTFSLNALYSPALAVIMHPLTYLEMRLAFGIYFGINVAALAVIAFVAQRPVRGAPAKIAVALGVFALPQTHWALRVGHFTEILALAALSGLLLVERRPLTGGALIAVLALKPQYLFVPLLYLVWSRNWRALAAAAGVPVVMALIGVVALAAFEARDLASLLDTAGYYADRVPATSQYLTSGQVDQSYPQSWQYSWYGVLLSAGIDPNPVLAFDLIALSFAAVVYVWWRCTQDVARVAVILGMLLVAPHVSFYNWSMVAAAAALLLRADLRPRAVTPSIIAALAFAAAASQAATPFPLLFDAYRPAATDGFYWLPPVALASIFVLAIAGRRADPHAPVAPAPAMRAASESADRMQRRFAPVPQPRVIALSALALCALAVGVASAAYALRVGPFERDSYFDRADVLAALPADFPVPPDASMRAAGPGESLPYRVEWRTEASLSEVAGVMRSKLDASPWRVVTSDAVDGDLRLQATRTSAAETPFLARLRLAPSGSGTRLRLEFSPVPASSVPGYDDWLESVGLVVHNVDPAVAR